MGTKPEFMFENFVEFFGDIQQVKKIMDTCQNCGNSVIHSHSADYSDMTIRESSRCPVCGGKKVSKIHSIN